MTLNDTSSTLALLRTRRSGKPREMVAPGPDADQLRTILEAAVRVPDHGKLAPWRFVVVDGDQRARLAELLVATWIAEHPGADRADLGPLVTFAHDAPTLVVAISTPATESKIPLWEQQLSVGAAIMTLEIAAHAQGFVASWLTGWAAYSEGVRDGLIGGEGAPEDRIAGFVFIGTAGAPLSERPRPDYDKVVTRWG